MTAVIVVILGGLAVMILERIFSDQTLPKIQGWWMRVIIINAFQAGLVIVGGLTWDLYLQRYSLFNLAELHPGLSAFIAYFILSFVYYWWHRWRHTVNFLWLGFHQIHHSPNRIEAITSFFKHPLEVFANSLIVSTITYTLLGLTIEAAGWLTVYLAYAEFFYHMNIKTPRWVGYFFQRPEMHRIHHQRGKHFNNFSDLPMWDMLFGTYSNPKTYQGLCGFKVERELMFKEMLMFKNVNGPHINKVNIEPPFSMGRKPKTPSDKSGKVKGPMAFTSAFSNTNRFH